MAAAYFLESVDRVMKVLDAFSVETPELRLTDLSERLDLPKPQILRIVSTLEAGGYVQRDPETKRYRLGIRLFQLGMVVHQYLDLRRVAQPVMQTLAAETLETVGLFVPDPLGPICVEVIDSPRGLRVFAQSGRRMPWNAGASPKVIFAHLRDEERERILARGGFKRYTPQTVIDPDRLREIAAEIRRAGYYIGSRDLDDDALGIAAPIFDHEARIAGTISIAAPVSRAANGEIDRMTTLVTRAAAGISRQLGYHGLAVNRTAADD